MIKILSILYDFWQEDDLFNKKVPSKTVEASKNILHDIQALSDNILRNIRPVDNGTVQELVDDDFILIDDRTQQELEDDDYASLKSENESEPDNKVTLESDNESKPEEIDSIPTNEPEQIDTALVWDSKKKSTNIKAWSNSKAFNGL